MIKEFKEFIAKGNVLDLAIGVVIGAAFSAIVSSLVDDIIMPIVGAITAGVDFATLTVNLMGVELGIGLFINAVIKFLIIAFVLFLIVKSFNQFKKKEEAEPEVTKTCPACKETIHIDATRCPHCTTEL